MDSIQSMASSSSAVPSSERTSHFVSQTEMEMESSKACHWSQLDYSTTHSKWSAETNSKYFDLLKEDPERGRFFTDFETLEVGEKISGGAQADIYEARNTPHGPFDLVVKVMKGDVPLKAFQTQWPMGMLSARSKYKHLFDLPLITILGGTVLRDRRLRGRFAFVMYRRWGDLRLLIDRRMKQERSTFGPFSIDKAIHLMLAIAEDMDRLHNNHDIIHRDLKASNVLVWGEFGEDISLVAPSNQVERIGSVVADFECSVGVLGTGFWRAPEILKQLQNRVPSLKVQFTHASDVYSYGMTCYEIVTGCIPYDGLGSEDTIFQILQGRCPELPHDVPEFVRAMIVGCWHCHPLQRPSFSAISMALKLKRRPNPVSVVIDNTSKRGASIIKVEQWNNPQPLTLLEVMQKLMDIDLSILKASTSSSIEMITQYFEVIDRKGNKVVNDKFIANITKILSLPVKMKWINESLETSVDGNIGMQMHIVEVIVERISNFLWALSTLLVELDFQIHSTACWTRKDQVKCVVYVEGTKTSTLLWELLHTRKHFPIRFGHFKIIVHRVAADKFFHLNSRLHNLKLMDLTIPHSSSNICVRHSKECEEDLPLTEATVIMCPGKSESLVQVSNTLVNMNYKIVGASVKYLGPYKFLKGRVNKTEDIDVGTHDNEEMGIMKKILDVATECGCREVNMELSLTGPSKELHDDLMRSLDENGLFVTGGHAYQKCSKYDSNLQFLVIEKLATEAS